ncbi:Mus7/MMS22 family-domain-containing protein [Xylogone sp. PMI_703]|nr:Mus7/MMS22 family-domain-containing protein [Xylogone sp. PMI_703]
MATWKERGEVQDSEDEESLDSQSSQADDNFGVQSQAIGDLGSKKLDERAYEGELHNSSTERVFIESEGANNSPTVGSSQHQRESSVYSVKDGISDLPTTPLPTWVPAPSMSPSNIANNIRFSSLADESDDESENTVTRADEEISKSYVELTASTSSELSSPPESPQLSAMGHDIFPDTRSDSNSEDRAPNTNGGYGASELLLPQESSYSMRRALRQRNPIQLHPYVVEQERYRQTLKAGGLKPLRFTQGSQQPSGTPDSDNFDGNNIEMQDDEGQDESQTDFNWDSLPSSSIDHQLERNDARPLFKDVDLDDDFEFPDLNELLHNPLPAPAQARHSRPQASSYTKKFKKPTLSEIRSKPKSNTVHTQQVRDIFDIPVSPPKTSSPFSKAFSRYRKSRSYIVTSSPSLPSQLDVAHPSSTLPTPSTSAMVPFSDMAIDDLALAHNPSTAEESLDSSPSSSDESIEIRKISKRIKGVLPASHLRLDQHKQSESGTRSGKNLHNVSPAKAPYRRGVAIPKALGGRLTQTTSTETDPFPFFDLSDEEENAHEEQQSNRENEADLQMSSFLDHFIMDSAEEDDSIDEMLPTKRRRRSPNLQPRKRRRLFSKTSSLNMPKIKRQPKIIEHLSHIGASSVQSGRRPNRPKSSKRTSSARDSRRRTYKPPDISIVDVVGEETRSLPQFIKIAVRTARSRSSHGRHSPSRKFIQLANRQDTLEAHATLDNWKLGRIQQKELNSSTMQRQPLRQIQSNFQTTPTPSSISKRLSQPRLRPQNITAPRKLTVSKLKQVLIDDSLSFRRVDSHDSKRLRTQSGLKSQKRLSRNTVPTARPAQLESTEAEYGDRHLYNTFTGTNRVLDMLAQNSRKRPIGKLNVQLDRFLRDGSSVDDVQIIPTPLGANRSVATLSDNDRSISPIRKKKKRCPKRIDVGASIYRQPNEPLITEYLKPIEHEVGNANNKLIGLGDFGTKYPRHFDILPIPSGSFFHECTFIGSGRLAAAINNQNKIRFGDTCPPMSFNFKDKEFRWGSWNESTSTEIGLCFDWLFDQLDKNNSESSEPVTKDFLQVVISIFDYIQTHLYFTDPYDPHNFASRMYDVLLDVIAHLNASRGTYNQKRIEILVVCIVILLQVLQISRAQKVNPSIIQQHETLLLNACGHCVGMLLPQGLDDIRKMYDDLQYLSNREGGLKKDQYASEGLVIIIQVLEAANILNGSFWNVVNPYLAPGDWKTITDARSMEMSWYSMFTLLPLLEFEPTGLINPGLRLQKSFDNWSLPLRIIKRVFALYTSDTRQSPSFNEYCAAIIGRCHHLIVEWGWWKCTALIGTLFDFFASQNLANLRNEEVYKSPSFLEELTDASLLDIESEDRCFHIFLKIIAVSINHMHSIHDTKGIRNLVPRLLPNHDRQYPKEEVIYQRDLASLRNHHDLLCTLFWAAPPDLRPSINLIQDLVVPDRSHKEACLINLKAWTNLAHFILSTSPTSQAFQPFLEWQTTFFNKLLQQYIDAESEVRKQADDLSTADRGSIPETYLQKTIDLNRKSIIVSMRASINSFRSVIRGCTTAEALFESGYQTFFSQHIYPESPLLSDEELTRDLIDALLCYINQVDTIAPKVSSGTHTAGNDDSQDYGLSDLNNWERELLISPLLKSVLPRLSITTKWFLHDTRYQSSASSIFMKSTVQCLARLISIGMEENELSEDYFIHGSKAAFEGHKLSRLASIYWPLFLGEVMNDKSISEFKPLGVDIGLEWFLTLAKPKELLCYEDILTFQLHRKDYYLLKAKLPASYFLPTKFEGIRPSYNWCQTLLNCAVETMQAILQNSKLRLATIGDVSNGELKQQYSLMLKELMNTMKHYLREMIPSSDTHIEYVGFVQSIIAHISSYASNIYPVPAFFTSYSTIYWPKQSDPSMYLPGLISYSLRLPQEQDAHSELFHYLYNGWKDAVIIGKQNEHRKHVQEAMKNPHFFGFMASEMMPAAISVALETELGWLICATYLPGLSRQIARCLHLGGADESLAFHFSINILKIALDGIYKRFNVLGYTDEAMGWNGRTIITLMFQFWNFISLYLSAYLRRHPDMGSGTANRMHAVARTALRTAQGPILRRSCRIVAGARRPLLNRSFHCSQPFLRDSEDPTISEADKNKGNTERLGVSTDHTTNKNDVTENQEAKAVETPSKARVGKSGRVRLNRHKQPDGLPPVGIPDWFWHKNVKCVGDPENTSASLAVYAQTEGDLSSIEAEISRQAADIATCSLQPTRNAKYTIHVDIYNEILCSLRAGLFLRPPPNIDSQSITRPTLLLQCPKEGGTYYLDSIIETIAKKLGADLVQVDAQDIAQIVGTYVDENLAWMRSSTSLLGYQAYEVAGKLEDYEKDSFPSQDDSEGVDDEDDPLGVSKGPKPISSFAFAVSNPEEMRRKIASLLGSARAEVVQLKASGPFDPTKSISSSGFFGSRSDNGTSSVKSGSDQWVDLKIDTALDTIISAADVKRALASEKKADSKPRDLIIQIKDYKEISGTLHGADIIEKFRSKVNKRWQNGRNVILVGTTSTEEGEPALSRPEIQQLQSDVVSGSKRTIFVAPDRREEQDVAFDSDEKTRVRTINIRHIEDMIRKLLSGMQNCPTVDLEKSLDSAYAFSGGLEDAVWSYSRVHRIATTIVGLETLGTHIDGVLFTKALKLLAASDEAKFHWGAIELKQEDGEVDSMLNDMDSSSSNVIGKDKLLHLRKTCTPHEKKLLSGVIIPADINTTFADIRAPPETVEALKTLTSLSLIRPEAFSYGVLATDKIPGLLLYGPPGTGKTLLAKAVAKESGATVLEVSGADVNDMYVGEGEKNVKAIFTLAKKLSPCVVFIDEADAIFAARGEAKRNSSHRELINQFLREWDGMNDLSAFIMVATNRPFDLDEAVLRRLPRRLLVDLPTQSDREAILRIHLKGEKLDESVSLEDLAKQTPFYSGSDLKNFSVAAALACIREENEAAAKHTGDEPYVYPERRTLTKKHFDKALEEISASISEDMNTLAAIRKFDEKYGDRKGRRKKASPMGFGGMNEPEKDEESARVRKVKV